MRAVVSGYRAMYINRILGFLFMVTIFFCACENYAQKKIVLNISNPDTKQMSVTRAEKDLNIIIQIVDKILLEHDFIEEEDCGGYWIRTYSNPFEIKGAAANLSCMIYLGDQGELVISFTEWYVFDSSEFVIELRMKIYQTLLGKFGKDRVKLD